MRKIVECVPNFSEGRNREIIEDIVSVFKNNQNVTLLSYEPDEDYNRTVVTLVGDPNKIIDALMPFVEKVLKHIDLNNHEGEHPRMGAVDVIPFIPIEDMTMDECIELANQCGKRIWETFEIPSFLYAKAAKQKARVKLPNIRKGEFEGMKEKIKHPEWTPDYGKNEIHPTFGVIGIGARIPLIAYNIDLDTTDLTIAKNISKAIRFSSGGYRYIQAGPVFLETRGHVQVTMNILDYTKNPIYRILETVKMEAARYHIKVPSCELVGLAPKKAFLDSIKYYVEREGQQFSKDMTFDEIIEYSKKHMSFRDLHVNKIIEANIK